MKIFLETQFKTKNGDNGVIITRKRKDGLFVTTFTPSLGLAFHSLDSDKKQSHETVKNFLRDIKGCIIHGDSPENRPLLTNKKRFIL